MPIEERWCTLMQRMHANARPGAVRTDFSFCLLQQAYRRIEEPKRDATMFGEVGHDEGLQDYEDNVRLAALVCYFISNTNGDKAGTGVAACYSGTAVSPKLECYVQPPICLTGWRIKAFLDMCESTAEFLHRAKFYYNNQEYQTSVMLTLVRLEGNRMLSVDSNFDTRDSREGDHCYTMKSRDTVLGSRRPEDIVNGPEVSGDLGASWLELYLLAKLAWRLDMLALEVEYGLTDSCRVISVFYHFLPVYMRLAMAAKQTAFIHLESGEGFEIAGQVNGSEVLIRGWGEKGKQQLDIKNRVMSMGFSAVLAMWRSWMCKDTAQITVRIPQSKLHEELVALADMRSFNIRAGYDFIDACLSLLLSTVYPEAGYYKERVLLYSDLLLDDECNRLFSNVYKIDVSKRVRDIEDLSCEEDTQYDHFAGVTHGLTLFTGTITGEKCVPKKGWSPQPLCQTRKMFRKGAVVHRVIVENGQLKSSKGLEVFSNALKCITGASILGNGLNLEYRERHYNTASDMIVNALLSSYFGVGPALWMLNVLSEGLIKVDRTNSNCVGQCATNCGSGGVKINVALPPKIANKLAYITDGTRMLTMVNASAKAVEVSTTVSGEYSWVAVDSIDINNMQQFRVVHTRETS